MIESEAKGGEVNGGEGRGCKDIAFNLHAICIIRQYNYIRLALRQFQSFI